MTPNAINVRSAYIILALIFMFIGGCVVFNISLLYGFLGSIALCICFSIQNGFRRADLILMSTKQLSECKTLFILILLIGAMISIWLSSGVIPNMIYYGFEHMNGINFLFTTFILTSFISIFMGSAFATISTVGIVFWGLGEVFGIPNKIVLGAIVSGAFIADKISPLSALVNLSLVTAKVPYRTTVKAMLLTLLPAYSLTGMIYFCLGTKYRISVHDSNLDYLRLAIEQSFFVSPALLLLPLLIVIMSLLGIKILKSISIGLLGGIIASLSLQKLSLINIISIILTGYKAATPSSSLNKILVSGGVLSMLEVLIIIMEAIVLSSLLEGTGIIKPIINSLTARITSKGDLIFKTSLISSMLTIVISETVGVILSGRLLIGKCKEFNINNAVLARTISDTGPIIAPLIPWNVNALFIITIFGISAFEYAPYAILCYTFPVISFFVACGYKFRDKTVRR